MQNPQLEVHSPAKKVDPPVPVLGKLASSPSNALTKILLVEFRNGEAVTKHPELRSLLKDGWTVRSAVPRIVESEGTKLLVVLAKPGAKPHFTRV